MVAFVIFERSIRNTEKNPRDVSYSDVLLGIMNEKVVITKYTLDIVVYIDKTLVHMIENKGLCWFPYEKQYIHCWVVGIIDG